MKPSLLVAKIIYYTGNVLMWTFLIGICVITMIGMVSHTMYSTIHPWPELHGIIVAIAKMLCFLIVTGVLYIAYTWSEDEVKAAKQREQEYGP